MQPLSERIDQRLFELAWSLWTELGINGTKRLHSNCMVALEELIILTAVIAQQDPRLRDEALDWCTRYHHFVSISRLKSLVKMYDVTVAKSFSLFAATLNRSSNANWPLFDAASPLAFTPSNKSRAPNCELPALLNLRLRALFGVGVRADLITFFLIQEKNGFTAADATEIGYSKRTLAELLDQLTQSGLFHAATRRNQQVFSFIKRDQMKEIIGAFPNVLLAWRQVLEVILPLRSLIKDIENKSAAIKTVEIRNLLIRLEDKLDKVNLTPPPFKGDLEQYWDSFSSWMLNSLQETLYPQC